MNETELADVITDAASLIHRDLGPGLLETVYETILAYELEKRQLQVLRREPIPVVYESLQLSHAFTADLIVNERVLIELASVDQILPVHRKQARTHLRFSRLNLGLLINFGTAFFRDGVERIGH